MKIFLRAKHWQLFIVLFGIPFIIGIIFAFRMFSMVFNHQNPDEIISGVFSNLPVMFVLEICIVAVLFGWMYSIGANLHKKLPPTVKMPLRTFN